MMKGALAEASSMRGRRRKELAGFNTQPEGEGVPVLAQSGHFEDTAPSLPDQNGQQFTE